MDKQTIAAFDFDGTITTKDTLFDFIKFNVGTRNLIKGLVMLSPTLIFYKLGLMTNNLAKQKLFAYFFKNKNITDFDQVCQNYIKRIDSICRVDILDKIRWHQSQNHTVIIVSASISNWIKPWADNRGIKMVLATEISVKENLIDGTFSSENCYGQEKVNRLLAEFPDRSKYLLYAYGDSAGDKELLALADFSTLLA